MTSSFRIRRALENDVGHIEKLVRGLAAYEKETDSVNCTADTYLRDGFGILPLYFCVLLEEVIDDVATARGFGLCYFGYSTWEGRFLYLEDLFIENECRGLGAGKKIMVALAEIATVLDCSRMVWQALDWNKPGLNFYNSIGATVMKGFLTLRLDREKMATFLKTRSE